jgi:hypothetical protein
MGSDKHNIVFFLSLAAGVAFMIAGAKINDPHWFWPAYVFGVRAPVVGQLLQ